MYSHTKPTHSPKITFTRNVERDAFPKTKQVSLEKSLLDSKENTVFIQQRPSHTQKRQKKNSSEWCVLQKSPVYNQKRPIYSPKFSCRRAAMYIHINMCVHTCIYIYYIHICIYMHICIYDIHVCMYI